MDILNLGFDNYSYADLLLKTDLIIYSLGHPPAEADYPAPDPDMETITAARAALALAVAKGNAPGAAEDREVAKEFLIGKLQLLGLNLESTTPGRRDKLGHTGFDLHKEPERDTTPTPMPTNVTAKPTGIPGQSKLRCDGVPRVLVYEGRATKDMDSGVFVHCTPAQNLRSLLFEGLERGVDWYFQIRAIGPNGAGPWSDPAMMMVV